MHRGRILGFVILSAVLIAGCNQLPGLKVLTDSIRKDPRVREVRGVASVKAGMSTLQLVIYYSGHTIRWLDSF